MRRFSLRDLASAPPAELSECFRARLVNQRASLEADAATYAPSHALLHAAAGFLLRGLKAAEAAKEDHAALTEVEAGALSATEELRGQGRSTQPSAQAFLRSTFASLISSRTLVQAAMANGQEAAPPLLVPALQLDDLVTDAVEDARAFCREKYGDSPETRVRAVVASAGSQASSGDTAEGLAAKVVYAPLIAFPLHELLKNAMGAHCRLVGADCLERLPAIEVRYGTRDADAFVSVTDAGGGFTSQDGAEAAARFLSTTNPEREATYTYSRNFGAPFEGLGMGLPLAALHARAHGGGHLHLHAVTGGPQPGVHAAFTFSTCGSRLEPEELPFHT